MNKLIVYILYAGILFLAACAGQALNPVPPPPSLPVIKINSGDATTWLEYPATVEGTTNVEIRPQVSGYLEKIYVEEGAYVSKGQALFRINSSAYSEFSKSASAAVQAAKASIEKAQVEYDRLKPLVDNNVIAGVQLKTAKANLDAAKASHAQAVSGKGSADITVGYTLLTAPVSGYIGHIPFKQGSLIGKGEALPLTVLSEVNNVHAYFSMSEADFLSFISSYEGKSTEEKIKNIPAVDLQLPDNTIYNTKGKIELVQGQFDRSSGTISFRAVFPNKEKLLRSGITGKIRIPSYLKDQLLVPQESTYELQDKVFVFALGDSNKVVSKQISLSGKSGTNYLVSKGLARGERIVFSGIQRLRDGAVITPQQMPADTVLQASLLPRKGTK
ncbi:MAG: efflux RND transporter periplasmic adaptor subunit [Ferruginibacter sp.]|nr:efflux RND transporter periplasmic adaptor subunit [Ferruginibacter sp.]